MICTEGIALFTIIKRLLHQLRIWEATLPQNVQAIGELAFSRIQAKASKCPTDLVIFLKQE